MTTAFLSLGLGLGLGIALLFLLKLLIFYSPNRSSSKHPNLPPAPPSWPILGHLHLLGTLPHQSLARLSLKYGPLMFLKLGSVGTLVVSNAAFAKECLKTFDQIFANRPKTLAAKILFYDYKDIGFSQYGPYWRDIRKICQLALFTSKRMEASKHIRMEEVSCMLRSIRKKGGDGKVPVDVNSEVSGLTRNIVTRMVLNKKYFADDSPEALEFKEVLNEFSRLLGIVNIGEYIPFLGWLDIQGYRRRMTEVRKRMDLILDAIIEEHQHRKLDHASTESSPDFVDVLLSLKRIGEYGHLDMESIKAVVMDMLSAGIETSALMIDWALSEIILNPRVQRKAQEELDEVVGLDRKVEESDLPHLKYLQAIVKEVFRLHPAVPFLVPHESMEAVQLVGGYHIPAKTRLLVNVWAMGRDPGKWERATEFWPERFEGSNVDVRGQDFELIPFGSGRRSCPGLSLGLTSVQLGLAALLQGFQWSADLSSSQKLDMSEAFGINLPKAIPLKAIANPRLPPHVY